MRQLTPLKSGDYQISSEDINAAFLELLRQGKIWVDGGDIITEGGGFLIRPGQQLDWFWARLTGSSGAKYSWVESYRVAQDTFLDLPNGRSGTTAKSAARERNAATGIANNTIVRLYEGFGVPTSGTVDQEYIFENPATVIVSPPYRLIGRQIFYSSGTYTPTAGTKLMFVEVTGGGGGGGGVVAGGAGTATAAGGGGGGSYANLLTTTGIVSTTVTVATGGAGGTNLGGNGSPGAAGGSTFVNGTLNIVANSGAGGIGNNAALGTNFVKSGGAGGTVGTGGDVGMGGMTGCPGFGVAAGIAIGGNGANGIGPYGGGGGQGSFGAGGGAAISATTYGAGGAGACSEGGGSAAQTGGAGTAGIIVVWEYT